jgi:hypothetical protein
MTEMLLPIVTDPNNDGLIYFSDGAAFHLSGIINKHKFSPLSDTALTDWVRWKIPKTRFGCELSLTL